MRTRRACRMPLYAVAVETMLLLKNAVVAKGAPPGSPALGWVLPCSDYLPQRLVAILCATCRDSVPYNNKDLLLLIRVPTIRTARDIHFDVVEREPHQERDRPRGNERRGRVGAAGGAPKARQCVLRQVLSLREAGPGVVQGRLSMLLWQRQEKARRWGVGDRRPDTGVGRRHRRPQRRQGVHS